MRLRAACSASPSSPAEPRRCRAHRGRARHVWCLGVLSAAEDIGRAVAELARVLHPDGVLGLLAFVRTRTPLTGEPTGTHFPAPDELSDHLGEHGLVVTGWTDLDAVARAPAAWDAQAARVERWIADHHGGEPAWRSAREDERRVADLIDGGAVVGQLLVVHPSSPRG